MRAVTGALHPEDRPDDKRCSPATHSPEFLRDPVPAWIRIAGNFNDLARAGRTSTQAKQGRKKGTGWQLGPRSVSLSRKFVGENVTEISRTHVFEPNAQNSTRPHGRPANGQPSLEGRWIFLDVNRSVAKAGRHIGGGAPAGRG